MTDHRQLYGLFARKHDILTDNPSKSGDNFRFTIYPPRQKYPYERNKKPLPGNGGPGRGLSIQLVVCFTVRSE